MAANTSYTESETFKRLLRLRKSEWTVLLPLLRVWLEIRSWRVPSSDQWELSCQNPGDFISDPVILPHSHFPLSPAILAKRSRIVYPLKTSNTYLAHELSPFLWLLDLRPIFATLFIILREVQHLRFLVVRSISRSW